MFIAGIFSLILLNVSISNSLRFYKVFCRSIGDVGETSEYGGKFSYSKTQKLKLNEEQGINGNRKMLK
jgi:hypothetical protein